MRDFEQLVGERVDRVIDIALSSKEKKPNQLIFAGLPEGNASVRWAGEVEPEVTGDYQFQTFSNSGIKLWIDDRLVINHWRQGWLPWKDVAKVRLEGKRRHKLRLEWSKDQDMETVQLLWKPPARRLDVEPRRPRSGRRSATASTTTSSTVPIWTRSSRATGASPGRRR